MQRAGAGDFGRRNRLVERGTDKTLRGQVIHFARARRLQQSYAGTQIGQIEFQQVQIRMLVDAEFFDAPEIDGTGATVSAENLVAFVEQQRRQIGPVLAGNAGDDGGRVIHERADTLVNVCVCRCVGADATPLPCPITPIA